MNRFLGGTTQVWMPDNLKSAVTKACLYDPELNPTYLQLARHSEIAVIPARSRKPKDKAKVGTGVKIAQMWILARLRKQTFTSIAEINAAIATLLAAMNEKKMWHVNESRRALFESIEKPIRACNLAIGEGRARLLYWFSGNRNQERAANETGLSDFVISQID